MEGYSACPTPHQATSRARCIQFARNGSCRFGTRCKFTHTALPGNGNGNFSNKMCSFCSKPGHVEVDCHFKKKLLSQLQQPKPTTLVVAATHADAAPEQQEPTPTLPEPVYREFNFVFSVETTSQDDMPRDSRWFSILERRAAPHSMKRTALTSVRVQSMSPRREANFWWRKWELPR